MNIYILCTLTTGSDEIEILSRHIQIKGIVGLSERKENNQISGYLYMADFCQRNNLDFISVDSYSLQNESDRRKLLELEIDLIFVLGWQRLIPNWLIEHCKISAIGVHGSSEGITRGRGRSPQNWAILLGMKQFSISLFHIDSGIDSGQIINTRTFSLNYFDDIKSSYYKVGLLTAEMILESIFDNSITTGRSIPQEGEIRYLPQRLPEDGEIDWRRSSEEVFNFIKALTRPYPGAFSACQTFKLFIWHGLPFTLYENSALYQAGEIIRIFHTGDLLVKTGNGSILIDDYSIEPVDNKSFLYEGLVLNSCSFKDQMQQIIDRHQRKYPDCPISESILNLTDP
jgi:methionyl-tRNA formyltransferase